MTIYTCDHMCFGFGGETILEQITFTIYEKDRVGIIGDNGAGKTTLIRLLLGQYEPTGGSLYRYGKLTSDAGYLPQNEGLCSDRTVYEEFIASHAELIRKEQRIAALEEALETCTESETIDFSNQLNTLYDAYVKEGGLTYRSRVESILKGLGFEESAWQLPIEALSGGQKTRLALGKIILRQPGVLILDEPTNHLDASSIQWLEEELKAYKGTLLVISHDRSFLDAVTTKTLLIEDGTAFLYRAPYSKYIELRNQDKEYQTRCYKQQQKQIAKIEAFIEKQRQWNRERNIIAAESRLKQLQKMTILEKPAEGSAPPAISFEVGVLGGKEVLTVQDLTFAFPERVLFQNLSFQILRGEKVFLQGPNGCGKSTLLKLLTGNLAATAGTFKIGANIRFSYYAQDLSNLNEDKSLFDEIYDHANAGRAAVDLIPPVKIRNALAAFGFRGDDVFQPVGKLSGGEKSRIAMLKLSYDRSSLLFLDEPTNHLDIKTREVLENALSVFEGTLVCVSHDRYFTQKLATRTINLPDYCNENPGQPLQPQENRAGEEYRKNKEMKAKLRKLEQQKNNLEKEVEKICEKLDKIEQELKVAETAGSDYETLSRTYAQKVQLEQRMEELFAALENLNLT